MKRKPQRLKEFRNHSEQYHDEYRETEYDILLRKRKEFEKIIQKYHKDTPKKK